MAYDYRPSAPNKISKRNGNAKSLLIGLMLGLVIGIAIAAGVAIYIARIPSPYTQSPHSDVQKLKSSAAIEGDAVAAPVVKQNGKRDEKKPYTFYDILEDNQTPDPQSPPVATTPSRANPLAAVDDKTVFYVQAGAYQAEPDADNQKATIALLGFEARVKTATLPDKGTLYRVRIGPFKSQDEATQAKAILQDNGITASLIKIVKNPPSTGVN